MEGSPEIDLAAREPRPRAAGRGHVGPAAIGGILGLLVDIRYGGAWPVDAFPWPLDLVVKSRIHGNRARLLLVMVILEVPVFQVPVTLPPELQVLPRRQESRYHCAR